MLIKVTEKHIRKGIPNICSRCPIAVAIEEKIGLMSWVRWGDIQIEGVQGLTPTSRRVRKFIANFDDGKPVKPFAFRLDYKVKNAGKS